MSRKEWLEVGKHSLYCVLLAAGIALLIGVIDLIQGWSFESEKFIIMLGLWLLTAAMFLGLSPFAMDSKQRGLEYLLTLPISRRRLLFIKLLPRLAAVVFFYLAFALLYGLTGNGAFAGGFAFFTLACFALFFISYSLSVVHENFIVQFIMAGFAWVAYLALCLFIVVLGFSWKFKMPAAWVGSGLWRDLSFDVPTLLVSIAVFLLMASPFIASLFLAFKRYDLKPARSFNRRHLRLFVPLLLLAFVASLGVTYLVQNSSADWGSDFFILKGQRLLKAGFPGKLDLYGGAGRRRIDTMSAAFWDRLLLEKGDRLYLSGYDTKDGSRFIGRLALADLSWKVLHRCPERFFVASHLYDFHHDGEGFVYLKRGRTEADRPGMSSTQAVKTAELELVRLDLSGGVRSTTGYQSPLFRKYFEPRFLGSGRLEGRRFWLIAHQWHNVLRLWEDGRVEGLGVSKGIPAYANGLLFTRGDHSLRVQRLLDTDTSSETVKEIEGNFKLVGTFHSFLIDKQVGEIYAKRNKRIVRIDLSTLAIGDVGPDHGPIWLVPPGDFYYVEYESWPGKGTDRWKKLYRLRDGKMIFLKQFDFNDAGYGHIDVGTYGVILWQQKIVGQNGKISHRFFAFPDLKELKFKKLN
jgi:hypothetical protein